MPPSVSPPARSSHAAASRASASWLKASAGSCGLAAARPWSELPGAQSSSMMTFFIRRCDVDVAQRRRKAERREVRPGQPQVGQGVERRRVPHPLSRGVDRAAPRCPAQQTAARRARCGPRWSAAAARAPPPAGTPAAAPAPPPAPPWHPAPQRRAQQAWPAGRRRTRGLPLRSAYSPALSTRRSPLCRAAQ
eukprot:scaffold4107_cov95-Isochrysis_galbana.AAC.2